MLLEQHVVDVVAGIALVAREIDGAVDIDRQIRVDLDQAAVVALIPVVAAPRLVRDVLDREGLGGWQLDVRQRAATPLGNRTLEHAGNTVVRDDEPLAKGFIAAGQWALPRQQSLDRLQSLV